MLTAVSPLVWRQSVYIPPKPEIGPVSLPVLLDLRWLVCLPLTLAESLDYSETQKVEGGPHDGVAVFGLPLGLPLKERRARRAL